MFEEPEQSASLCPPSRSASIIPTTTTTTAASNHRNNNDDIVQLKQQRRQRRRRFVAGRKCVGVARCTLSHSCCMQSCVSRRLSSRPHLVCGLTYNIIISLRSANERRTDEIIRKSSSSSSSAAYSRNEMANTCGAACVIRPPVFVLILNMLFFPNPRSVFVFLRFSCNVSSL